MDNKNNDVFITPSDYDYVQVLNEELYRYKDMTDEIWNWAIENNCEEVVRIIKEWCC